MENEPCDCRSGRWYPETDVLREEALPGEPPPAVTRPLMVADDLPSWMWEFGDGRTDQMERCSVDDGAEDAGVC